VDTEIKESITFPRLAKGLVINRARYGSGDRWADITKILQSQVHDDSLAKIQGISDPAPNVHKTTVIEGSYGGSDFVLSFNESFPLYNLTFGKPSKESVEQKPEPKSE
jgi:hypothetical protein